MLSTVPVARVQERRRESIRGQHFAGERIELLGLLSGRVGGPDGVQPVVADHDVQVLDRVLPEDAAVVGRQGGEPLDLRADEVEGLVGALQVDVGLPAFDRPLLGR